MTSASPLEMIKFAKVGVCFFVVGAAAFFATGASAGIAFVDDDCWHTTDAYEPAADTGAASDTQISDLTRL